MRLETVASTSRTRTKVAVVVGASVLAVMSLARSAAAQSEVPVAEALYQAGRDLMAQKDYENACPKFAESYRLDPATGTLLNLAACHEAQGKLATAWTEYMDVSRIGRRDGRADRIKYAREHADALLPRLSRLTIATAPDTDATALEITLDGMAVGQVMLGVAAPLDPGPHVVVATAPGKKPYRQEVVLGAEADQQTLTIPALEAGEPVPVQPVQPVAVAPVAPPPAPSPPPKEATSKRLTVPVIVAGSVTIALAAATTVTGIVYLNHRSSYQGETDPVERKSQYDQAQGFQIASTALFVGTLAGAGATTYLYLTSPESTTRARLTPVLAPGLAFVSAEGRF